MSIRDELRGYTPTQPTAVRANTRYSTPAPIGDPRAQGGFGTGFNDFASGLQTLARNVAAGFAKDPAVRQQNAEQLAYEEQQKAARNREMLATLFDSLKTMATGVQGMGEIPPSTLKLMQQTGNHISTITGDPAYGQQLVDYAVSFAQLPKEGAAPDYKNFVNPQTQDVVTINTSDPEMVNRATAEGYVMSGAFQSDVLSPEAEQQRIRMDAANQQPPTPRAPTEMELYKEWLDSPDPRLRAAAEAHFKTNEGGPFGGTAMDSQASNLVIAYESKQRQNQAVTPEETMAYELAKRHLTQPRIITGPDGQSYQIQPSPLPSMQPGAQSSTSSAATPVLSGVDAKLSTEEATKITALQEGVKDITAATAILAPEGALDRSSVVAGQSYAIPFVGGPQGVPFTGGRDARQKMQRGIEGILRAMTGAAAPESEVTRYMGMFFPSPLDSEATAMDKLAKAQAWAEGIVNNLSAGRPQIQKQDSDPLGIR